MISLARELTRCVSAREGSLVLQIGSHRMLRSEGFFPVGAASMKIFLSFSFRKAAPCRKGMRSRELILRRSEAAVFPHVGL